MSAKLLKFYLVAFLLACLMGMLCARGVAGELSDITLNINPDDGPPPLQISATCECGVSSVNATANEELHVTMTVNGMPFYEGGMPAQVGVFRFTGGTTLTLPGEHEIKCACELYSQGVSVSVLEATQRAYVFSDLSVDLSVSPSPATIELGESISVACTPQGGAEPYNITIEFGDGNTVSEQNVSHLLVSHTYQSTGLFSVKCTVTDNRGESITREESVLVEEPEPPQIPELEINLSLIPQGAIETDEELTAICFASGGVGPYNITIEFGDGTLETSANETFLVATHVYQSPDLYTVRCTATDSQGTVQTIERQVLVREPRVSPSVEITVLPGTETTVNGTLTFICQVFGSTSPPEEIAFDFGNETFTARESYSLQKEYRWAEPGDYLVQCRAEFGDNETVFAEVGIRVTELPEPERIPPSITEVFPYVANGTTLVLDVTVSDPDSEVVTVTVSWGDSTNSTETIMMENGTGTRVFEHTYPSTGNYTLTVTVTDSDGGIDSLSLNIILDEDEVSENQPPKILYLSATYPTSNPLTLSFTCVVADPDTEVLQVSFDYGDEELETGEVRLVEGSYTYQTIHTYGDDTPKLVTCTVSDGEVTVSKSIKVFDKPLSCAGGYTPGGAKLNLCYGTTNIQTENGTEAILSLYIGVETCGGDCGKVARVELFGDLNGDRTPDAYYTGYSWTNVSSSFSIFINPFSPLEIFQGAGVIWLFEEARGKATFWLRGHLDEDNLPEVEVVLPIGESSVPGHALLPRETSQTSGRVEQIEPVRPLVLTGPRVRWPEDNRAWNADNIPKVLIPPRPPLLLVR